MSTIAVAVTRMTNDVNALGRREGGWATYTLLVTDGEVPALGPGGETTWVAASGSTVGLLRQQLMTNGAHYPGRAAKTQGSAWRGPYLETGSLADPWGYRYAINVKALTASSGADVVVLSPGPDGAVETAFEANGLVAGGDDVMALIGNGGL